MLDPALAGFRERAPGIALTLRAAEDLEPFRLLERTLRDSAVERRTPPAG